ncbi:RidA family protein [Pseudoteredinibacter isoporae]|uniref:RidA family protein n=1 Tax=Pseudoteredinibacter isoporae TaxID=570281 RepID=UPI00310A67B7
MTSNHRHNPFPVAEPYDGIYAHGVEVLPNSRQLHISGQIGIGPDGILPNAFEDQARQAFENIKATLKSADMDINDLVHMRFYILDREHVAALTKIRKQVMEGVSPAVTTFLVSGLVNETWLIEIEGLASKKLHDCPSIESEKNRYARLL